MKQITCRLCLSPLGEPVLNLGSTPLANEYLEHPIQQDLFPLEVCCCTACGHYQLNEQVEPERMFRHYLFVAGTSPTNVEHFRKYAVSMLNNYKFPEGPKVLDIASNDGTLLRHFKNLGCKVLGIDPAINLAEEATRNGIPTIPYFFTEEKADEILKQYDKFDLITANNVFAHVPDMIGFTKGIKKLLAPQGVYTFEVSYFGDVVDKTLFDTIYHEHTSYHTLQPLFLFFQTYGLHLFDVEKIDNHGGSIRVIVRNIEDIDQERWNSGRGYYSEQTRINDILSQEKDINLKVHKLARNIEIMKLELNEALQKYKAQGKSIALYGVPAKATTLIYALELDESMIDFAVDDAPLKQNRYTPGKHIPILHPDAIYEHNPDVLLILAWNFSQSIIENHKKFKGKWIIPIPELKIYGG